MALHIWTFYLCIISIPYDGGSATQFKVLNAFGRVCLRELVRAEISSPVPERADSCVRARV